MNIKDLIKLLREGENSDELRSAVNAMLRGSQTSGTQSMDLQADHAFRHVLQQDSIANAAAKATVVAEANDRGRNIGDKTIKSFADLVKLWTERGVGRVQIKTWFLHPHDILEACVLLLRSEDGLKELAFLDTGGGERPGRVTVQQGFEFQLLVGNFYKDKITKGNLSRAGLNGTPCHAILTRRTVDDDNEPHIKTFFPDVKKSLTKLLESKFGN